MNNDSSSDPKPIQSVRVERHRIDWEASDLDLAEITAQRALNLAPQIATGSWYLNPRYTVSSSAPSAEFFRTVLNFRSAWLRTCRRTLGNSGQRRLARHAENRGRRGALLDILPEVAGGATADQPSWSAQRSGLSKAQQREVIDAGQLAKQLAYVGLMFLDGKRIPPRAWHVNADLVLLESDNSVTTY